MLVNPNCLSEYVHHDVQVDACLKICFNNVKSALHFTKNVSYFVYFDVTCNCIIHKYVKNHAKVYVTYIYKKMSCRWNEIINGGKPIELLIPNPWKLLESIKHMLDQSLNWVVLINKNWIVVPKLWVVYVLLTRFLKHWKHLSLVIYNAIINFIALLWLCKKINVHSCDVICYKVSKPLLFALFNSNWKCNHPFTFWNFFFKIQLVSHYIWISLSCFLTNPLVSGVPQGTTSPKFMERPSQFNLIFKLWF